MTGDCGDGQEQCNGLTGAPPASLAEFRFDGVGNQDFYDISLVDGYNVPVSITPRAGNQKTGRPDSQYDCVRIGCSFQNLANCPRDLKVMHKGLVVGCKSACARYNTDEACCRNQFDDPNKCKSSEFANYFKSQCPQAYSFAYNDQFSTYTCKSDNSGYDVTFC